MNIHYQAMQNISKNSINNRLLVSNNSISIKKVPLLKAYVLKWGK